MVWERWGGASDHGLVLAENGSIHEMRVDMREWHGQNLAQKPVQNPLFPSSLPPKVAERQG